MTECHKSGHLRHGWPSTPAICDQCNRPRMKGNHQACSKVRQKANQIEATLDQGGDQGRNGAAEHELDQGFVGAD